MRDKLRTLTTAHPHASQQAVALERDALSRLRSRAGGSNEYEDVRRTAEHYMTTREVEQRKLSAVLEKIQADAIRFRTMLQNVCRLASIIPPSRLLSRVVGKVTALAHQQCPMSLAMSIGSFCESFF